MNATRERAPYVELDECHRQIHRHLDQLAELARHMAEQGLDARAQSLAREIEAYFSSTSREHHAQEERQVFPPLLAGGKAELVAAVRSLQQDHGWIEENWLELAPQLRAIGAGENWFDAAEFAHAAEVFHDLCMGHIALEETLIYPESKALWAEAVAQRAARLRG